MSVRGLGHPLGLLRNETPSAGGTVGGEWRWKPRVLRDTYCLLGLCSKILSPLILVREGCLSREESPARSEEGFTTKIPTLELEEIKSLRAQHKRPNGVVNVRQKLAVPKDGWWRSVADHYYHGVDVPSGGIRMKKEALKNGLSKFDMYSTIFCVRCWHTASFRVGVTSSLMDGLDRVSRAGPSKHRVGKMISCTRKRK